MSDQVTSSFVDAVESDYFTDSQGRQRRTLKSTLGNRGLFTEERVVAHFVDNARASRPVPAYRVHPEQFDSLIARLRLRVAIRVEPDGESVAEFVELPTQYGPARIYLDHDVADGDIATREQT